MLKNPHEFFVDRRCETTANYYSQRSQSVFAVVEAIHEKSL
jgi:hypothetical protein